MKAYFGPQTPTHMHPEAQHPSPVAPPKPGTNDQGTSPLTNSKSIWEKLADKQMREDPFQLNTSDKSFQNRKSMREKKETMGKE